MMELTTDTKEPAETGAAGNRLSSPPPVSDPIQERVTAIIGLIVSYGIVRYRSAYCVRQKQDLHREAEQKLEQIRTAIAELVPSVDVISLEQESAHTIRGTPTFESQQRQVTK